MSDAPKISPHRVLVALDLSPPGLAALEAAAHLAAELQAELQGLFVEDVNLFKLAALPFVREVGYASPIPRQLDLAELEQALRARSEQVRLAVASAAQRVSLQWSFEVTRGRVTRTCLAAGSEADLLLMGREGASLHPSRLSRQTKTPRPILVVYDGTEAGGRCLNAAACLARHHAEQVLVVITADDDEAANEHLKNSLELLNSRGASAVAHKSPASSREDFAAALKRFAAARQARVILINRGNSLLDEVAIESLVNDLDCPVGLVR